MTKPQIWVAAFLILFILLFMLGRISENVDEKKEMPNVNTVPQTNMTDKEFTGLDLVKKLGCTGCHGHELEGTMRGPALENISKYYSRDKLLNYLRNPSSYMDSERFQAYQEKYPNVMMPSYNNINVKELGKVAEYLLTR